MSISLQADSNLPQGYILVNGTAAATVRQDGLVAASKALCTSNTDRNTAVGTLAGVPLFANTTGTDNTGIGDGALAGNTNGIGNTAVGSSAMSSATTGSYNIAVGGAALLTLQSGNGNVMIGGIDSSGSYNPIFDPTTENNRVIIGSSTTTNAYCKVAWQTTSDARDKTNINQLELGLDFVEQLSPVSYQFKTSRDSNEVSGGIRYGFLAQDILALEGDNPVIIDNEDPEHLSFKETNLIPVLVNAIKELKSRIEELEAKVS